MGYFKGNKAFIFFTLVFGLVVFTPLLFSEGLFYDGLFYSSISRNLAEGEGSLWIPQFSETIMNQFYEHPPLSFWLQSIFFKVFGDHFYTEKLYSFVVGVLMVLFIVKIWKTLFKDIKIKALYWIALFCWFTMPRGFWCIQNNMLENTLTLFCLISVFCLLKSLSYSGVKKLIYLVLGSFLIICAFLSKGFPGLFPLGFFFCYYLCFRSDFSFKKMLSNSLILLFSFALISVLILLNESAYNGLKAYFDTQVLESLSGLRVPGSRLRILGFLLDEFIPSLILVVLFLGIYYKLNFKRMSSENAYFKYAVFFILLGFSASLPLMVSPKQMGFYIVPSYPYFALGFGILILPVISNLIAKIKQNALLPKIIGGIALFAFCVIVTNQVVSFGKLGRDKGLLTDMHLIENKVPVGSIVAVSQSLNDYWHLYAYGQRMHKLSFNRGNTLECKYLLSYKNESSPKGYSLVKTALLEFDLHIKD